LTDILSASETITEVKENLNIISKIDQLSRDIQSTTAEVSKLYDKKIPTPNVVVPNTVKVDNLPETWNINWEKAPKPVNKVVDIINPVKTLYKSLEGLIEPFMTKVQGFMSKVTEHITEPDRTVINNNFITEYYGNRKVVYRIKETREEIEVLRES